MFSEKKVHQVVRDLIALAPQMMFIPDRNGNYPLHVAIKNQQCCNTIFEIFQAFSEVGSIQDATTNLLPFALAAIGDWRNEKDQITITYQLLREDPHSIIGA